MQEPSDTGTTSLGAPARDARARWLDGLLVAALAFAVRLVHALLVAETPFFEGLVIDAMTYRRFAEGIAASGAWGGPFYQPPLYPAFVALLLSAGLRSIWATVLVQCALGALTSAMVGELAQRLVVHGSPPRARVAGLAAGVAAALYGPIVLYDVELLPPAVVHAALLGALLLALTGRRTLTRRDLGIGLLVGTATVGWSLSAVFAPLALFLRARRLSGWRLRAAALALALLGAAIPVGVTWAHNARGGAPNVLISWNAGINLWLGNGPAWRHTWRARPGAEFEPELERPDRAGVTGPHARTRFFVARVWEDITARPGAAVLRTLEKLYYAWHGREIRRNQDYEILRDASPLVAMLQWEWGLFFPSGIALPMALLGLWRRRRDPVARAVGGTALAYSLAHACFFVAARYRLPVVLLLLPYAADWLSGVLARPRVGRGELVAAGALVVALNAPNAFTASFRADPCEREILLAQALREEDRDAEASVVARRVAASCPDLANAQMLLAETLKHEDRCPDAVPVLRRVAALVPRASTPWLTLGHCLREMGVLPGAEAAYRHVLALHPYHAEAMKGLALIYQRGGRPADAVAILRRFRAQGYRDDGVEFDFGRLLFETEDYDGALFVLVKLYRTRPRDTELRELIDTIRVAKARRAAEAPGGEP